MKVCRRPKVYLIGHTEVQPGLLQYLQDTQRVWNTTHYEEDPKVSQDVEAQVYQDVEAQVYQDVEAQVYQSEFPQWVTEYPADSLPEFCGRICYDSWSGPGAIGKPGRKSNQEYLNHVKLQKHGALAEHPVANFIVIGAGRSMSHELVRHRAGWAYSQQSTRFCDGEKLNVVLPHLLDVLHEKALTPEDQKKVEEATLQFVGAYEKGREMYTECFEAVHGLAQKILAPHYQGKGDKTVLRKIVRSCARSLLPIGTEAPICFSANYRALHHAFTMRATEAAELEIREVFLQVFDLISSRAPNFLEGWEKITLRDGTTSLQTRYGKI